MAEIPKGSPEASRPAENLNAQERGLQHVVADIFMNEKPAKISKEQLQLEAGELKKLGFGDCTVKVSPDGHTVAIVRSDGTAVKVDDKSLGDASAIKKADEALLKPDANGKQPSEAETQGGKKGHEPTEADKRKIAQTPKPGGGKKVEAGEEQDVQNNSVTNSATFGNETQVTVSHDHRRTFVAKTGAEASRPVGAETNQSTNVSATANRDLGPVQVEAGVSATDGRNHNVYGSVSRDMPDKVGGTVSYTYGNNGTHIVSYTRPLVGDSDNPKTSLTINHDIYNQHQTSIGVTHKLSNHVDLNVNVTPHDVDAKKRTTFSAGVTLKI